MRKHHVAITMLSLAGAGWLGFSSLALAQAPAPGTPPPPPAPHAMPGMVAGMMHHHGAGRQHWMAEAHARHALIRHMATWALFHRPADLNLSPSDVQTIAEAILLRHGERDWKVGDVAPNADHTVSFAFLTEHGDVIARFSMNTATGRITRTD